MRRRFMVEYDSKGNREISEVVVDDCIPLGARVCVRDKLVCEDEYPVSLESSNTSISVKSKEYVEARRTLFSRQPILRHIMTTADGKTVPLSQQFSFVEGESFSDYEKNSTAREHGYAGVTLWDEFHDEETSQGIVSAVKTIYNQVNPQTGRADIDTKSALTPYIGLVTFADAMSPQYDDTGKAYFNPDGVVSVGDFLNSLSAIKVGEGEGSTALSLDGMSDVGDYYNVGYNMCLETLGSPFYRLYSRADMSTPITRAELAYILVVCWSDFTDKYDTVYSGRFHVGVNLNWDNPSRYVGKFKDGRSYKVYKKCHATDVGKITAIDLNFYKGEDVNMTSFRQQIKSGEKGIPLPMFMSLLEIDALDIFPFFDNVSLEPMKEVSRGELAYILVKLSKLFSIPFVDASENSY